MTTKVKVFSAVWCAQCKILKAALNRAGVEYEEIDVDTDAGAELATLSNVRTLPTTLIVTEEDDSIEVKRIVGVQPVSEYAI